MTTIQSAQITARLEALRRTELLDTKPEEQFDRLTRLASNFMRCPMALMTLVEQDRYFFKSFVGLPHPWSTSRQAPLSHSFCNQVVEMRAPVVIPDSRILPNARQSPALSELG